MNQNKPRGLIQLMWMPNGMVAAFDEKEDQLPEYQGKATKIFAALLVDAILEEAMRFTVKPDKPKNKF